MNQYSLLKKIMKLNYKILILIFSCLLFSFAQADMSLHGMDGFRESKIDAAKNARLHSNMGNIYFSEKNYIGALKEYQIAYNLTHNTNGSSTYLYNIARCFIKLGNYELARKALLGAIDKDCINITYYETLVDCYINLNTAQKELKAHLKDKRNPYNQIIAGLIYLKTGHKTSAKIIFDEFINDNPDMIISEDIRLILKRM